MMNARRSSSSFDREALKSCSSMNINLFQKYIVPSYIRCGGEKVYLQVYEEKPGLIPAFSIDSAPIFDCCTIVGHPFIIARYL
ncbi:MAG: hypothetical protein FWG93_07290 [Oscillospiraceae bacterium]|nr:hypothetical protein [Oscillospiraceae bacterium]